MTLVQSFFVGTAPSRRSGTPVRSGCPRSSCPGGPPSTQGPCPFRITPGPLVSEVLPVPTSALSHQTHPTFSHHVLPSTPGTDISVVGPTSGWEGGGSPGWVLGCPRDRRPLDSSVTRRRATEVRWGGNRERVTRTSLPAPEGDGRGREEEPTGVQETKGESRVFKTGTGVGVISYSSAPQPLFPA